MQPPEGAQVDLGKAQVIDRAPKVIKELKFGVMYVFAVVVVSSVYDRIADPGLLIQVQR